jgi:hypothetical protein
LSKKDYQKVNEATEELITKFREVDKSDIVESIACEKPLDIALWVLCVAKEKLGQTRLTAEQIASTIVRTEEVSITASSLTNALKRASNKVHRYYENGIIYYEIMKPGKERLLSLRKSDVVNAFYFEPDTKYTAKRLLKNQVFSGLTGSLKILDPYCSEKTLDVLANLKDKPMKILTRLGNIRERDKGKFVRDVADFKTENPNVEFRDYPNTDIHDRYIISEDKVTLIGHSMKDLGAKESFAVILGREYYKEIYNALNDNFIRRWDISAVI